MASKPLHEGMSFREKQLAEKAIKLRYNGLINQLKTTLTMEETANEDLRALVWGDSYYGVRRPDNECKYPARLQRMITRYDEVSERRKRMKQEIDEAIRLENDKIREENDKRRKRRAEARSARMQLVSQLQVLRDDAIIDIASSESRALRELIDKLPDPKSIKLPGKYKLSRELTAVTGIGDKNPENLIEQ